MGISNEGRWEVANEGLVNCMKNRVMNFDTSFGPTATTQELFSRNLEQLIGNATEGYNGTRFV